MELKLWKKHVKVEPKLWEKSVKVEQKLWKKSESGTRQETCQSAADSCGVSRKWYNCVWAFRCVFVTVTVVDQCTSHHGYHFHSLAFSLWALSLQANCWLLVYDLYIDCAQSPYMMYGCTLKEYTSGDYPVGATWRILFLPPFIIKGDPCKRSITGHIHR